MRRVFLLFFFVPLSAFATSLTCKDARETFKCWITLNGAADKATNASLIGHNEVRGTYSPVFGSTSLKFKDDKLDLVFEDNNPIDWEKINPDDKCYVTHGTKYTFKLTKKVAEWEGKLQLEPNIKIHPKKPGCRVPELEKEPERAVGCKPAKLVESKD